MKWIAPVLVYLTVGTGILWFHNAWGALVAFHLAIVISLVFAKPALPINILFKSKSLKWSVASILICGSSGITLYFFGLILGLQMICLYKLNRWA